MENSIQDDIGFDDQLAARVRALRAGRNWSLDELARRSGVSRATLSRLENGDVSPTASALGRLCAAYGMTMSRLMRMVENEFAPVVPRAAQWIWMDPTNGFQRRAVSPPNAALAGEVIECSLMPATRISYPEASKPGLEHHLLLLEGRLTFTIAGRSHELSAGDCLRYQLHGPTEFVTPENTGARYILFMV